MRTPLLLLSTLLFAAGCCSTTAQDDTPVSTPTEARRARSTPPSELEGTWLVAVVHRGCSPMSYLRIRDGRGDILHPGDGACTGPLLPCTGSGTVVLLPEGRLSFASDTCAFEMQFQAAWPEDVGHPREMRSVAGLSEPAAATRVADDTCDVNMRVCRQP